MNLIVLLLLLAGLSFVAATVAALGAAAMARGPKAGSRFPARALTELTYRKYLDKSASFAATVQVELSTPVGRAWESLTHERLHSWIPLVSGFRYPPTTLVPGAARAFRSELLAVNEELILCERPHRLVTTATGASMPVLESLCQEYELTPTESGGSRLTWTIAASPRYVGFLPLRLAAPIARPFLRLAIRRLESI